MLILPPGHAEALRLRRRLSTRERWIAGSVAGAVAAILVVVLVSLATAGRTSSHGCIYATIPAATGAQEIYQCGATARSTCASIGAPGAFTQQAAQALARECRKAGLPVGR